MVGVGVEGGGEGVLMVAVADDTVSPVHLFAFSLLCANCLASPFVLFKHTLVRNTSGGYEASLSA